MAEIIEIFDKPGRRAPFVTFRCDVCGKLTERQKSRFNNGAARHACGRECHHALKLREKHDAVKSGCTPHEQRMAELSRMAW